MRNQTIQAASGPNNATVTGSQIDAGQIVCCSFHLVVGDGTAAGTFKIQASNDIAPFGQQAQNFVVTNWVDVPSATVTQTAGTQQALISLSNPCYRWLRAVWIKTSGGTPSTLTINMNSTGV
jgi:hypothetical protein